MSDDDEPEDPRKLYEYLIRQAEEAENDADEMRNEAESLTDQADDQDRRATKLRGRAASVDDLHQVTSGESDLDVGMVVWTKDLVRRTVAEIAEPVVWDPEIHQFRGGPMFAPPPEWRCVEDSEWHEREWITHVCEHVRVEVPS